MSCALFLTIALFLSPLSDSPNYSDLMERLGFHLSKPGELLGALNYRRLRKEFRRSGRRALFKILKTKYSKSSSTKSRWRVTFVWDATTLRKFLSNCDIQGKFWSGQFKQTLDGIEIFVLYAVLGDGQFSIPIDFEIRYPDTEMQSHTTGPRLCKRMISSFLRAARAEGIELEHAIGVGDSWFTSREWLDFLKSKGIIPCGPAKTNWVLYVHTKTGTHKCTVKTLRDMPGLKWRTSGRLSNVMYARVHAVSPTFGEIVVTVYKYIKGKRFTTLFSYDKDVDSVRLIRAYKLRCEIEHCFKILKGLFWIDGFGASKPIRQLNHFVFRFGLFVLLQYTAQYILNRKITIESIVLLIRRRGKKYFKELVKIIEKSLTT